MTKLANIQLSLIAESDFIDRPIGDWDYDELGTNKFLVPNSPSKLGTDEFLVPNSSLPELGTDKFLVPNLSLPELGTDEFLVPNLSLPELGTKAKLGTDIFLVPNSHNIKLSTSIFLVPNSQAPELGTKISLVPNSEEWKPPIGCLQQKWIKDRKYWYWRYYDNRGKKASLYLGKDYNKAVLKAIKIGIPTNAKNGKIALPVTDPPTPYHPDPNIIDIAPTAYPAPRAA